MTETADAGAAPAATDAQATSSTATQTAAAEVPRSARERMVETLQRGRQAASPERTADTGFSPSEGDQRPPDANAAGEARPDPDGKAADSDEEDAEGKKGKPAPIPYEAFQKRLGREKEKQRALSEQIAAKDHELARRDRAMELLVAETERLRASLMEGRPYDERDEQLAQHDLERRARTAADELEHAKAQALEEARAAAQQELYKEQLRAEFDAALEAAPLVDFATLKAAVARAWKANPSTTVAEVAQQLHAQKLEIAQRFAPRSQPAVPATVSNPSTGAAYQYPRNAKGMLAQLQASRRTP